MWVVGTSGSGKTTLARAVASRLDLRHVEIDALHWEPGWAEADAATFSHRLDAALAGDGWVVDGNYRTKGAGLLPERADLVVWLDYGRRTVMRRVIVRTAGRLLLRRELWNGNRERWHKVVAADHPIRWAWRTHGENRRRYEALLEDVPSVRLRSPRETNRWLLSLTR